MKEIISALACCLTLVMFSSSAFAQKSAEDYVKASRTFLQNRDLDGAIAALDKAVEQRPDYAQAYMERQRLHMLKGAVDRALADLDKTLLLDPEMKQAYAERGRIRMMKGDGAGALADLDNAIVRGVQSDEVYSSRANLRMMKRDHAGALSDFNTAISMNPKRISYYLGRGSARSAGGDDAGALVDYNYIIDRFEQEERERRAAGKSERQAVPFDFTSPVIKGPESSSGKLETSPSGKPAVAVTRTDAVVTMKLDMAGMTAEKLEYMPNVAGAYLNRGSIYVKRGDSDLAIADLTKSININPFFGAYYTRARELRKRGDLAAAIADFTKAIESQPRMGFFYVERGATLLQSGKDEEAERDFAHALELDPTTKTAIENRRAEVKGQSQTKPE